MVGAALEDEGSWCSIIVDGHHVDPVVLRVDAAGMGSYLAYHRDTIAELVDDLKSNRVSANVRGLGNTMRISLNDNLLKRCTPEEITTTMGHEMGHYVLHHIFKDAFAYGLIALVGFFLVDRLFAGELAPLVMHFAERRKITPRDAAEIRRLLDEIEKED